MKTFSPAVKLQFFTTLISTWLLCGPFISPCFAQTAAPNQPGASGTPIDTDGDGLSDRDETALYGTNPNLADTDGDGQSDGAEVRAGTDLKSAGSVFKILGAPAKLASGGWRISWASVSGKSYALQRWNSGDLSSVGLPRWFDLLTVTASGPTASAEDTVPGAAAQRFYRILLVEGASGGSTPSISQIQATPPSALVEGIVTLTVAAQDNGGIASVIFFDGLTAIGPATRIEGDQWRVLWPVTISQNGTRTLTAKAVNLAGNAATSLPSPYSVAIANPQIRQSLGQVTVSADAFQTNGNTITPSGNVRIELVTLASNATLRVTSAQGSVSGQGKVSVPGLGQVFEGAFTVDAATGMLTPTDLQLGNQLFRHDLQNRFVQSLGLRLAPIGRLPHGRF